MRKLVLIIFLLAVVGVGAYWLFGSPTPSVAHEQGASPASTGLPASKTNGKVMAEGKFVPVRHLTLGLSTGGTVDQVPVAEGDHVEGGQLLVQLETRKLELQLAQAEANLASAQAQWSELQRGPSDEDLTAAEQAVASAQAAYDQLLHPDADELLALKSDVDKAQAQLSRAQAAYDRIGGDANPNAAMTLERAQLQAAWLDLQKAQALLDRTLKPSSARIQQALAALDTAKSELARLTPNADRLAALRANVDAARAARDLAAENLENTKVVAPFAGTVAALDAKVGEQVAPGARLVQLADLSAWQIETDDLTEQNIVGVHEGCPVNITLDALPGLQLSGKVTRIKLLGEKNQGDMTYTVVVTPDETNPQLRWNMTAHVTFEPP